MTLEEIRLLDTPALRDAVDANLERDPNAIALDKRLPHAALVATQVKYLQRARRKLPTYFAARAIIPSLAFEQASSEAAAACKTWSGNRCIDLTCGLGVDTLALAKAFGEVISIERDAVVAETARINFARMGATNITVVNDTAEAFLQRFATEGHTADLIYADPDRRSDTGRKLVLLEECRPDIRALLPLLRRLTPRIAVKLSPLFDVAEAFRIFGDRSRVRAISQHGECKELLVETGDAVTVPAVGVTVLDRGEAWFATGETPPDRSVRSFEPPYRYLLMPDVALRKTRTTERYAATALPDAFAAPDDGYLFLNRLPDRPPLGRLFEIRSCERFDPARLKRSLRERGIRSAELHLHRFPLGAAALARRLGIREGGEVCLAFTGIGDTLWAIELKTITL